MENEERLIDAKPIMKFIVDGLNNPDLKKAFGHDAIEILAEIEYAPTVDAVEVVRCKDCKRRGEYECPMYYEKEIEWDDDGYTEVEYVPHDRTDDDGFCDRGERRNDEA